MVHVYLCTDGKPGRHGNNDCTSNRARVAPNKTAHPTRQPTHRPPRPAARLSVHVPAAALPSTPPAFDREHLTLARYATYSRDSRGRLHHEPPHPYRGPFVRDRDRILHSSAFRRLAGKMQVFTGEMGIYHRTRLTHTLEVASVARTIGRVLRLNEDLVEALALMHDIGHPPFGHCGEDALDESMHTVGGFSHNQFALTIVTELEQRYADFPGLNLSIETLAGQDNRAHKTEGVVERSSSLEVQVVDLADSIAYDAHDVDDALHMGLLSVDELSHLHLIHRSLATLRERHGLLPPGQVRQLLVRELINCQIDDLITSATETLQPLADYRTDELSHAGIRLGHSDDLVPHRRELERFLFDRVYRHPKLIPIRRDAADRLRRLFDLLVDAPERLPLRFRRRLDRLPLRRVIGEYIAGMTDAFFADQYRSAMANPTGPLADW